METLPGCAVAVPFVCHSTKFIHPVELPPYNPVLAFVK
jgi:hypothetical protein